jgi:hypothetical protein
LEQTQNNVISKTDFLQKEFPEVLGDGKELRESKGIRLMSIESEGPPVYQRPYRAPVQKKET